jgi:hypothetical protein
MAFWLPREPRKCRDEKCHNKGKGWVEDCLRIAEDSAEKHSAGDLSPTESWGDRSQDGLQNMRVVGDTELIWNRQQ